MKRIDWKRVSKYLIAFLLPILLTLLIVERIDNDSWGVLAQGRYITEHGLYHEDVLSMHEGLHTTLQNYAFSVCFYAIYSVFGAPGIYITMLLLNILIIWLLYRVCMLLSKKNTNLSLIMAAATDCILVFGFIVTRAQMLDYVVILILIYALESFIKTNKIKYLWWIPVLSVFLANFHASVWWMIFAIIFAYTVDLLVNWKKKKIRWKPFVLITILGGLVGLINPYGLEMLVCVFDGYKNLSELDFVIELKSFNPLLFNNPVYYLGIILAITMYIYSKKKIYLRHLLMFFGFLAMGLASIKGMSELLLTMFIPLAYMYGDNKMPQLFDVKKIGQSVQYWTAILLVLVTPAVGVVRISNVQNYPSLDMKNIMDEIDKRTEGLNKENLKVYVGYNQGGYVEYRGYPAFLDPRGGEFTNSEDGEKSILGEWLDIINGMANVDDFLAKYDFDFLVTETDDLPGDKVSNRYERIYGEDDDVHKLFEKRS